MLKEILPFVLINTLLLHIPLLALTRPQTESQTEKQIHLLCMGWRNFFFQLCCCVSFFCFWQEIVLGVTYLPSTYHTSCAVVSFFGCGGKQFWVAQISFLVVAENSFRCYLLTYHTSCAIVSVYWLRREIIFGCTVSKKDSYLVSLIERESASKCVYFIRSNIYLLCISLLCIYLLYRIDPESHMWLSG